MEGSTRLRSSYREGRPPAFLASNTFLDAHDAGPHSIWQSSSEGTSPRPGRFLYPTLPRSLKAGRMTNRCAAGKALSWFWSDARQIGLCAACRAALCCHDQPTKQQRAYRDGEKPSSPHRFLHPLRFFERNDADVVGSWQRMSPTLLNPLLSFEKSQHGDRDRHHHPEHQRVAPFPLQLRHVLEVHPVDADDEGQRHENRRNDRQNLHDGVQTDS